MGNSKSTRLKRSRSEYGSTRSVAFSLPSRWDRHSYAYGDQFDNESLHSNSSSTRSSIKPTLRNNSSASSSNNILEQRRTLNSNLSRSSHSLYEPSRFEKDRLLNRRASGPVISSNDYLAQKQYSDAYLRNDLKRVFRAQDRSNSVANVYLEDQSDNFDPTATLDRKLLSLKYQRHELGSPSHGSQSVKERRDGATERRIKSRKTKKAPLPNPSAHNANHHRTKTDGWYRKKAAAPMPPIREKARSLSSLVTEADEPFARRDMSSQQPLFQEIEAELEKRNIAMSPTDGNEIEIPKPDYDGPLSNGVLVMPPPTVMRAVQLKKVKPKAPSVPTPVTQPEPVDSTEAIGQLSHSDSTEKFSPEGALAANLNHSVLANVEVHRDSAEQKLVPQSPMQHPPPPKKEVREIAVQYDAPVEIAIQCSGDTLKLRMDTATSHTSSLNELLQMFIKAGKEQVAQTEIFATVEGDDSESICSKASSYDRNLSQQKVVPIDQVLASVPEPPPLPDSEARLIPTLTVDNNELVDATADELPHSEHKGISVEENDKGEIECKEERSSEDGNLSEQNVVPMDQVLASSVPKPPPLPDFGIKLIQTRTIGNDTPISLAPGALSPTDENHDVSTGTQPGNFSTFQQQLRAAYEKLEQKRKVEPITEDSSLSNTDYDNFNLHPLEAFRYSDSILGIEIPQETESDSGHDEPSDCSNSLSQGDRTPSIPDFVLAGIAKSMHTDLEYPYPEDNSNILPVKQSKKSDKSKFNSIKRLKKSVRQLILPKRSANLDEDPFEADYTDQHVSQADSNWTLSGRSKSSRADVRNNSTLFSESGITEKSTTSSLPTDSTKRLVY